MDRKTFKHEDKEYAVVKPNGKHLREALSAYNRAFSTALSDGALLRPELEDLLEKRGIWGKEQEKVFSEKQVEAYKKTVELAKPEVLEDDKLATKLAKEVQSLRDDLRVMLDRRLSLDVNTAEAQAEQEKFNYLVAVCTVYNDTGEPVFKSYEDFELKISSELADLASKAFSEIFYGIDEGAEEDLPENKVLNNTEQAEKTEEPEVTDNKPKRRGRKPKKTD